MLRSRTQRHTCREAHLRIQAPAGLWELKQQGNGPRLAEGTPILWVLVAAGERGQYELRMESIGASYFFALIHT